MPYVMRGIMDDIDVGKADDANDEQAEGHGQQRLKNDARLRADKERQVRGIRFSQSPPPEQSQ
jgi:hypothetical protein